jgi:DNA-binding transcriptional LysR family regulator
MVPAFNSLSAIISAVIAGLGVTLIPEIAISSHVESKKLVILPWAEDKLEVARLMIWH